MSSETNIKSFGKKCVSKLTVDEVLAQSLLEARQRKLASFNKDTNS